MTLPDIIEYQPLTPIEYNLLLAHHGASLNIPWTEDFDRAFIRLIDKGYITKMGELTHHGLTYMQAALEANNACS